MLLSSFSTLQGLREENEGRVSKGKVRTSFHGKREKEDAISEVVRSVYRVA